MNENDKIVEISKTMGEPQRCVAKKGVCDVIPSMPGNPQYAFAYIRFQDTLNLLSPAEALAAGTVFDELSMPYCGWNGMTKH